MNFLPSNQLSGRTLTGILAVGLVFHCLMLISLRAGFLNPLFNDAMHRSGQAADFFAVYQAGTNLQDGTSIYSTAPVHQSVPYFYPYRYHPFVAYTVGFASQLFPPFGAYGLWVIVQEILLVLNIMVSRSLFSEEKHRTVATLFWLLFTPFYLELFMGQFSFAMTSLVFWAIAAWMKKEVQKGDVWWALSLVVKSNSVLFVPVLLRGRRWKSLLLGAGVAAVLAVPYFTAVPGTYDEFARNYTERLSMSTLLGNQGFSALIGIAVLRTSGLWTDDLHVLGQRVVQMDQLMEIPVLLWTLLVVGTALYVTFKTTRVEGPELFLLWLLAFFLFYKHVWEHHYVMLLPVFVLLYYQVVAGRLDLPRPVFWTAFVIIALPTAFITIDRSPVMFDPELSWEPWKSFLYHLPKPLAVLVLFVSLSQALIGTHVSVKRP